DTHLWRPADCHEPQSVPARRALCLTSAHHRSWRVHGRQFGGTHCRSRRVADRPPHRHANTHISYIIVFFLPAAIALCFFFCVCFLGFFFFFGGSSAPTAQRQR